MERFFNILSNLDVHFFESSFSQSRNHTPTAVFQIVGQNANKLLVQMDAGYHFQFEAFYRHNNQLYQHPYTLRTKFNPSTIEPPQQMTYEILLYLELKRLEDFENDDLKRYYEVIDQNIDSNEELYDFHDVYLMLHYEINGQSKQFHCNSHLPIHLPKFISNSWTSTNTLTRFRYDAENRDGTFPCEMKLHHVNLTQLQSYKIVLCLISNTIPARMDYHAIRWLCRLKPKASRQNSAPARKIEKEKSYCLNHSSGIVMAQVFGPGRIFASHLLYPSNNPNYVRSYFEPEGFRTELHNSVNKDTSVMAIAVIKGTDYPILMKNRRKDPNIRRYLPFNELENVNNNLETSDGKIIKLLKDHKDRRNKQLILSDDNETGTYSQAHVRLYVAAYDENDVLLTEALHPPLRNSKTFEQLRIVRIVQPKHELYANESAYVYCEFDYSKLRSETGTCPYEFELVFTRSISTPSENQLLRLFDESNFSTAASFVPNCVCLLQFQVPNDPRYDKHRIFIRLRHRQSKDYNPSAVALSDDACWTYHADTTSVTDLILENDFNELNNISKSDLSTANQTIQLDLHPVNQSYIASDIFYELDDSNPFNRRLNTPDLELSPTPRFSFPQISSDNGNDK